jgi:hypothetical protein
MDQTAGQGSSSKVILSIIVILVIAAIAFALARSNGDDNGTATTTPNGNGTSTGETAFSGNLFALASRGGDWNCTWSSEQDGVDLDGSVLVSGGKFKSDVTISGVGMNATAHTIGDGAYVYSWQDGATTGVKIAAAQGAGALEVSGGTQTVPLTGEYNYDCDPWTANVSAFTLPSNVTFQEAAAVN